MFPSVAKPDNKLNSSGSKSQNRQNKTVTKKNNRVKITSRQVKEITQAVALNRGVTDSHLTDALKEFCVNLLQPRTPFALPRPAGALVHPVHYKNEILLVSDDPTQPFEGVVEIFADFDEHIVITSPTGTVSFSNYQIRGGWPGNFPSGQTNVLTAGVKYSFPFGLFSTNGSTRVSRAVMVPIDDPDCYAWNQEAVRFEQNRIWVLYSSQVTGSKNYDVDFRTQVGAVINGLEGVFRLCDITMGADGAVISNSSDLTLVAGTRAYTDSSGFPDGTSYLYIPGDDGVIDASSFSVTGVSGSLSTTHTVTLPVSSSQSFLNLIAASEKYCFSGGQAVLTPEAGLSTAGHISCCLVPREKYIPHLARPAIEAMAKLPQMRTSSNPFAEGAAVSRIPDIVTDMYLTPIGQKANQQKIVFAWHSPPTHDLQAAELRLHDYSNIEFETYEPEYAPIATPIGGLLMEAVVTVFASVNPCSGNPSHVKNIKDIAVRVAKDPTVRMMGGLALQAAKVLLPTFLGLLV